MEIIPKAEKINFLKHFPKNIHKSIKRNQRAALSYDEAVQGSTIQELPTGTGKTAKGIANLLALREYYGDGTYFYITPNKSLVDQIKQDYPEFHVIYGRNEYDCYYYEGTHFKADEVPCSLLDDCPFRVNFDTGETYVPDMPRCPYLDAKWKVKTSKLVVCTMAFYLYTTLFSRQWGEIKGVVVDEAHQIPHVIRNSLSYEISDYHLQRIIEFLRNNKIEGEQEFSQFLTLMKKAVQQRFKKPPLLEDTEIYSFINVLGKIKKAYLYKEIAKAAKRKHITEEQQVVIKKLEMVLNDLHRYISSFEYSIETENRKALNYTYAFLKPKVSLEQKVEHSLNVKCYHVATIIKKIFPKENSFFMSATIGDIEAFRMVTGLDHPFFSHDSEFPVENARIYLPNDVENLAVSKASRRSKTMTLGRIAKACESFVNEGHRCLVLVVSEEERQQFLLKAANTKLQLVTYGAGIKPRTAVQQFKDGLGDVLLGTFANYGEGIDLPNQCAPVTFALRPAYPPMNDPKALYEERRFKQARWIIWNNEEMQRILQARGRNIRSETDRGVTFCMSDQYRRIVLRALPKYLIPAYKYQLSFDECVNDALALLNNR